MDEGQSEDKSTRILSGGDMEYWAPPWVEKYLMSIYNGVWWKHCIAHEYKALHKRATIAGHRLSKCTKLRGTIKYCSMLSFRLMSQCACHYGLARARFTRPKGWIISEK